MTKRKQKPRLIANLNTKEDDGDETDPAVQSVEVGVRRRCQIVTIEDCFQTDC